MIVPWRSSPELSSTPLVIAVGTPDAGTTVVESAALATPPIKIGQHSDSERYKQCCTHFHDDFSYAKCEKRGRDLPFDQNDDRKALALREVPQLLNGIPDTFKNLATGILDGCASRTPVCQRPGGAPPNDSAIIDRQLLIEVLQRPGSGAVRSATSLVDQGCKVGHRQAKTCTAIQNIADTIFPEGFIRFRNHVIVNGGAGIHHVVPGLRQH